MGLLDDLMADDAAHLVDTDVFGESVTYLPGAGSARAISAVVVRFVPEPHEEIRGPSLAPRVEVTVRNDATYGIAGSELDLGRDKVRVSDRLGRAAKDLPIRVILEQDAAMMRLRLG